MNYRMVFYILGRIMTAVGMFLALPLISALLHNESVLPFVITMGVCFGLGFVATVKKPKNREVVVKDAFVCVALSWVVMSVVGALPFMISGEIKSFVDAFFEAVSGFTTTGSSIVKNIEGVTKSAQLWRALTQWLGGMGVLVFLLAVLPRSDIKSSKYMHLMKAEVPGPTVGKVVPKIADSARVMYLIYLVLTVILLILLLFGDMDLHDSLCHALSTAGTGGFGIMNDSVASYSAYSQYVIATFMLLFGINFNVYFFLIIGHFFKAVKSEEVLWFLGIVFSMVAIITGVLYAENFYGKEESFRHAYFQVASIISTSGFSTADFALWPNITQALLVLIMLTGACAGCTAGGMKIPRIILLFKNARREIKYILHPRTVKSVKMDGKSVGEEVIRATIAFFIAYIAVMILSAILVIAFDGVDIVTGITSAATCLGNVGPGLSKLGPASNFAFLSDASKLVLIFDMLAGRLELFPLFILLSPSSWKKST